MNLSTRLRRIGRRCFSLIWLPFATIFIGMMGLPKGSYGWSELPALSRYSILAVGILGASALGLMTASTVAATRQNRRLLTKGLPAEAVILKLTDTGTTVNRNPLARLTLEVHPAGEPHFQAHVERLIPRLELPQIQPGAVVKVKYDPNSKAVALLSGEGLAQADKNAVS